MQRRGNLLTSSLASGFIFGFLSGIPFLGLLNCACCSLILGSGILTSYLLVKGSDIPISYGRAAIGGFFSGAVAVPVYLITAFAFSIIMGGGNFQEQFDQALDQAAGMYPEAQQGAAMVRELGFGVLMVIIVAVCAFFYSIFGMLGGLLGRAIFEKRGAPPAPGSIAGAPAPPENRWQGPEGGTPPVNPS